MASDLFPRIQALLRLPGDHAGAGFLIKDTIKLINSQGFGISRDPAYASLQFYRCLCPSTVRGVDVLVHAEVPALLLQALLDICGSNPTPETAFPRALYKEYELPIHESICVILRMLGENVDSLFAMPQYQDLINVLTTEGRQAIINTLDRLAPLSQTAQKERARLVNLIKLSQSARVSKLQSNLFRPSAREVSAKIASEVDMAEITRLLLTTSPSDAFEHLNRDLFVKILIAQPALIANFVFILSGVPEEFQMIHISLPAILSRSLSLAILPDWSLEEIWFNLACRSVSIVPDLSSFLDSFASYSYSTSSASGIGLSLLCVLVGNPAMCDGLVNSAVVDRGLRNMAVIRQYVNVVLLKSIDCLSTESDVSSLFFTSLLKLVACLSQTNATLLSVFTSSVSKHMSHLSGTHKETLVRVCSLIRSVSSGSAITGSPSLTSSSACVGSAKSSMSGTSPVRTDSRQSAAFRPSLTAAPRIGPTVVSSLTPQATIRTAHAKDQVEAQQNLQNDFVSKEIKPSLRKWRMVDLDPSDVQALSSCSLIKPRIVDSKGKPFRSVSQFVQSQSASQTSAKSMSVDAPKVKTPLLDLQRLPPVLRSAPKSLPSTSSTSTGPLSSLRKPLSPKSRPYSVSRTPLGAPLMSSGLSGRPRGQAQTSVGRSISRPPPSKLPRLYPSGSQQTIQLGLAVAQSRPQIGVQPSAKPRQQSLPFKSASVMIEVVDHSESDVEEVETVPEVVSPEPLVPVSSESDDSGSETEPESPKTELLETPIEIDSDEIARHLVESRKQLPTPSAEAEEMESASQSHVSSASTIIRQVEQPSSKPLSAAEQHARRISDQQNFAISIKNTFTFHLSLFDLESLPEINSDPSLEQFRIASSATAEHGRFTSSQQFCSLFQLYIYFETLTSLSETALELRRLWDRHRDAMRRRAIINISRDEMKQSYDFMVNEHPKKRFNLLGYDDHSFSYDIQCELRDSSDERMQRYLTEGDALLISTHPFPHILHPKTRGEYTVAILDRVIVHTAPRNPRVSTGSHRPRLMTLSLRGGLSKKDLPHRLPSYVIRNRRRLLHGTARHQKLHVMRLKSLSTELRQLEGVSLLPLNPFAKIFVDPHAVSWPKLTVDTTDRLIDMLLPAAATAPRNRPLFQYFVRYCFHSLNESQSEALQLWLTAIVKGSNPLSRFSATQGPPGTGKTHVLVRYAAICILRNKLSNPSQKILLVANSNVATDHLLEVLHQFWDTAVQAASPAHQTHLEALGLRCVRIGPSAAIGESVRQFDLKNLVEWAERRVEDPWEHSSQGNRSDQTTRLREVIGNVEENKARLRDQQHKVLSHREQLRTELNQIKIVSRPTQAELRRCQVLRKEVLDLSRKLAIIENELKTAQVQHRKLCREFETIKKSTAVPEATARNVVFRLCDTVVTTLGSSGLPFVSAYFAPPSLPVSSPNMPAGVQRYRFSSIIVDEGAQITDASLLIPLRLAFEDTTVVIVGDQRQLGAVTQTQEIAHALQRTLFVRLEDCGFDLRMLTVQYRMHDDVLHIPNAFFYNNRLQSAPGLESRRVPRFMTRDLSETHRPVFMPTRLRHYALFMMNGADESRVGSSFYNAMEGRYAICLLLTTIALSYSSAARDTALELPSIYIISPYMQQVNFIQRELAMLMEKDQMLDPNRGSRFRSAISRMRNEGTLKVCTVDSVQGQEADIVIYTVTRSQPSSFVEQPERLNVSLTRARHCLWIVGTPGAGARRGYIKLVYDDAGKRHAIFNVGSDQLPSDAKELFRKVSKIRGDTR